MTKFLNIDLDTKLGGSTPSDVLVSSQKAIKTYADSKLLEETTRAQGVEAGLDTRVSTNEDDIAINKDEISTLTTDMSTAKTDITNLKTSVNTQANLISDLQDSKQDKIDNLDTIVAGAAAGATAVQPSDLATVATSGSYNDLSDKPTIPAAQVNSDWNATSGMAQILNKPTLGTAASKDATDFATATQGAKADTAVQPASIADMETKTNAAATYQPKGDYATKTELATGLATKADTTTTDTLRNDVDGLGDQVSDIEGKIPGDASTSNRLATKADVTGLETSLAKVAKTGSYNDLDNKPTIGNAVLTITRNNESAGSFTANATENQTINIAVPVSAGDVSALPDTTKYGASVLLTMDSTTYKVSASLKDQNGDVLGTVQTIDLPLESVVVSGKYDATTKEVVLTLQDGSEIRFSVADLVDGLQIEITAANKLSADLVDASTTVNKFVTSTEKNTWNGKQDAINDLATIRSNAQAGKSASDTMATYGNIVTHNVSEFATLAQGVKADTAVQPSDLATVATSGSYNDLSDKPAIPTVNNATLTIQKNGTTVQTFTANQSTNATANISVPTKTSDITNDSGFITNSALAPYALSANLATVATSGSYSDLSNKPTIPTVGNGTITITQGGITKGAFTTNQSGDTTVELDAGGSSADIDNLTITENASNEIQAVAVINQNTGVLKSWTGTLAEYNALETKSDDTIYVITDDDSEGVNVYTKSEVDDLLNNKQDILVSGTTIKTVNGETILGSGNIKIEASSSGGGVSVGTVFVTPRTGTIEGAVEANGGSYNIADYSGDGSIGALLTAGNIAYVSKAEFQTQVANTGACDSFGWDGAGTSYYAWYIHEPDGTGYTTSTNPVVGDTVYYVSNNYTTTVAGHVTEVGSNETGSYIMWTDSASVHYRSLDLDKTKEGDATFLVPKLNPWHVGKNAPVVGNGMTLGLTDGTNNAGLTSFNQQYGQYEGTNKNAYGTNVGTTGMSGSAQLALNTTQGVTTDPTKSGMVADLSETTNLRVMVQLATGATDQALETCMSVLADVSALNAHRVIEFQAPTAANGYTWYRKYADGWVEQGGTVTTASDTSTPVTLPIPMAPNQFFITNSSRQPINNWATVPTVKKGEDGTKITVAIVPASGSGAWVSGTIDWQVSGMAA